MFGGGAFGGGQFNWNAGDNGNSAMGGAGGDGFGGGGGGAFPGGADPFGAPQQSGLGGFVGGDADGGGFGGQSNGGHEQLPPQMQQSAAAVQTLTPVTVRMLLDSFANQQNQPGGMLGGPDAAFMVSGRELGMLTMVACVESIQEQPIFKLFKLSDGTGRIDVQLYKENQAAGAVEAIRPGDFVRAYGHVRAWGGQERVSCHQIARVENANEIAYHGIEVAHVHLALTGKLVKPGAAAGAAAPAGASMGAFAGGSAGPHAPPPAGGAAGPVGSEGFGGFGGAQQSGPYGGAVASSSVANTVSPYGGGGMQGGAPQFHAAHGGGFGGAPSGAPMAHGGAFGGAHGAPAPQLGGGLGPYGGAQGGGCGGNPF